MKLLYKWKYWRWIKFGGLVIEAWTAKLNSANIQHLTIFAGYVGLTAKLNSANINNFQVWSQRAKSNGRQYCHLYGSHVHTVMWIHSGLLYSLCSRYEQLSHCPGSNCALSHVEPIFLKHGSSVLHSVHLHILSRKFLFHMHLSLLYLKSNSLLAYVSERSFIIICTICMLQSASTRRRLNLVIEQIIVQ